MPVLDREASPAPIPTELVLLDLELDFDPRSLVDDDILPENGTADQSVVARTDTAAETESDQKIAQQVARLVLPRAVRIQDSPEEERVQARFAQGLGRIAIGEAKGRTSPVGEKGRITSILDAIDEAARGNTAWLEQNIAVTSDEALTNEGIMRKVVITRDQDGDLEQNGQKLEAVMENAIRLHPGDAPGLHEVTRTAALDGYVIDELDKAGRFEEGYVLVIPRPAPTGVSGHSLRKYGHFENLAVAWNIISKTAPGTFELTPLFTAGVVPLPDEESQLEAMVEPELDSMYDARSERRHDLDAISGMYEGWGLPVPDTVPGLQRGFLIHRSQLKHPDHPELDVAERYDAQLGPDFFLGRKRTPEDVDYLDNSKQRMEALEGLRQRRQVIMQALVDYRHTFANDMAAAHCLARLVEGMAIDYVYDTQQQYLSILGPALGAAAYNTMRGGGGRDEVRLRARVNTCGHGGSSDEDGDNEDNFRKRSDIADDAESHANQEDADCVYVSRECPLCGDENVLTVDMKFSNDPDGRKWRIIQGYCKRRCMRIYAK